MMIGAPGGAGSDNELARKLIDAVQKIAESPEDAHARLDAIDAATLRAEEASRIAATASANAKEMMDQAEAMVIEAQKARDHADEFVEASKGEIDRGRIKLKAETEIANNALAERERILAHGERELAEQKKATADLAERLSEQTAALNEQQAKVADLKTELEKATAAANERERVAANSVAEMRAVLAKK